VKVIKVICTCLFLVIVVACGGDTPTSGGTSVSLGSFDPSLVKDPSSSRIWMSYSAVETSMWPKLATKTDYNKKIHTRLAFSDDAGKNWTDYGIVNTSNESSYDPTPANPASGDEEYYTWVNEVSSLVYDQVENNWKLFWHHYRWCNGDRQFEYGWIGLKTAPTPAGLLTASETKLFAGSAYIAASDSGFLPGIPQIPISSFIALTEPGVISTSSGIYLSMLGVTDGAATSGNILLFKYSSSAWSFVGTFLYNPTDGPAMGYDGFSAPAMFEKGGNYYLMVSPQTGHWYKGTLIFQISSLDSAALVRDTDSNPVIVSSVFGTSGSFNGAAGYVKEATASGIIYGQVFPNESSVFRMIQSGVNL
jgi:hypothetical protein